MADDGRAEWMELRKLAENDPGVAEWLDAMEKAGHAPELTIDDMGRGVARGVPVLGAVADEANAGINTLLSYPFDMLNELTGREYRDPEWRQIAERKKTDPEFGIGDIYEAGLENERLDDRFMDEEYPGASLGSQLVGGVASGIGAGTSFPTTMAKLFGRGGGLLPWMGKSAVVSALLGGADAYGRGEGGVVNRGEDAAAGGGISGLIGGALPLVSTGVNALVKKFTETPKDKAADIIEHALQSGGPGRAPEGVALAESNPKTKALLDRIASSPGPASDQLRRQIAEGTANLTEDTAKAATAATDRAAAAEAAQAFPTVKPTPVKDLAEAAGNLGSTGTLIRKALGVFGGKLKNGEIDEQALEALRFLTKIMPGAEEEIITEVSRHAANEAQRAAIGVVLRSVLATQAGAQGTQMITGGRF